MSSCASQTTQMLGKVGRGFIAGCVGGAVASWVMNQYQEYSSRTHSQERAAGAGGAEIAETPRPKEQEEHHEGGGDDATVKTAVALTRKVLHTELTDAQKQYAGPAVHYGYGTLLGGFYGALSELFPVVSDGGGILYASAAWLIGDEIAVPALGLSKPPTEYPPSTHAASYANHVCYGVTLDLVRRVTKLFI